MKVSFYTLGCKVNQYETKCLKTTFSNAGYRVLDKDDDIDSDIYIINSCTVTAMADKKTRQYIGKIKKKKPNAIIAVVGCYSEMNPAELTNMPEVDIVLGTKDKDKLLDKINSFCDVNIALNKPNLVEKHKFNNLFTDNYTRAFLKVQDGCNKFCTYCIIPYARNTLISKRLEEIQNEAAKYIQAGYKEIVITGINTALYGTENCINNIGIEQVIKMLNEMDGDFRIRLGSLEPNVINADYVKRLLKYKKLCPHMHLSLQSGSDNVLKLMNRKYTVNEYIEIVNVLQAHDKGYGITTDIIVGFPGETEEDFQKSIELLEKIDFCKVHIFKYSKRKGTKAADMLNEVPEKVKTDRAKRLAIAAEISEKRFLKRDEGSQRTVLVETDDGWGYTENYLYLKTPSQTKGEFYGLYIL